MTAQEPERLVFEGREYGLATEPLNGYLARHWRKLRFRPSSSALWRGYIGTWEIRDGRLFLIDLNAKLSDGTTVNLSLLFPDATVRQVESMSRSDHLSHQHREDFAGITSREAADAAGQDAANKVCGIKLLWRRLLDNGYNLLTLLPRRASRVSDAERMPLRRTLAPVSRAVFAEWFTGDLRAPYGKLVEYVHAGYASVYEKELRISVSQGIVKEIISLDVVTPSAQS